MDSTQRAPVGVTDRGQSVFDFSIGISLFLIVVIGVLLLVPTAFGAITDRSGATASDMVAADRVADFLVETAFANPKRSYRFSSDCVRDFFQDTTAPPACSYFSSDTSLGSDVGLSVSRPVNVTIRAERSALAGDDGLEILCWDDATNSLITRGESDCTPETTPDLVLQGGPKPSDNGDFQTARRSGRLAGENVHVIVRTW